MAQAMKTSKRGRELIKEFEGVRLTAYRCPAGIWTVGAGHTSGAGAPKVTPGMKITAAEADEILSRDLVSFEKIVNESVKVPLTQEQFDALVSWVYNVGGGNARSSTLIRKLNAGDYTSVPSELAKWTRAGKVILSGLVRRRKAEAELWSTKGAPAPVAAPKPSFIAAIAAFFGKKAA